MSRSLFILFLVALGVVSASGCDREAPRSTQPLSNDAGDDPPEEAPARGAVHTRTVYVPAYSHLRTTAGKRTLYAITLSVRNVDPASKVRLTHVDYFDTSGHRVRRYLERPRVLEPLETAEFFVDTADDAGGSGANFLVYWEGPSDAHPLLTEAVMIGFMSGAGYTAFTTRGVELGSRPQLPAVKPSAAAGSSTAVSAASSRVSEPVP